MNDIAFSILLGIVGGIMTSALIFGLGVIFKKIILPWYQSMIYKGVNISGTWIRRFEVQNSSVIEARFHLKQKGNKLYGIEEWSKRKDGNLVKLGSYNLSGEIADRFVHIKSINIDKKRIGYLTLLLQVVKGGDVLEGKAIYYDEHPNEIVSRNAVLTRMESIANSKILKLDETMIRN
ncbi:MAG: hypothetical protein AAF611_10545 [Bacteroidota bacterium]